MDHASDGKAGFFHFKKIVFHLMDTEFLRTFVIVVERGSIAEAARRLSLTPASVALRIRTLEKEFGARLLVRSGRTVMPTETGRSLAELGRSLLHDVANLKSALTTETAAGELRIGAVPTAITGLMPRILQPFRRHIPGWRSRSCRGNPQNSIQRC